MKKLLVFVIAIISTAYAQDRSSGCGMGWQVTKSMTTTGSYTRALTNATFSNTFAMTSGTSGCARHDLVMKQKEKIYYVESNLVPLRREVAMGEGERVNALAAIWGCSDASKLSPVLRKNYRNLFYKKGAMDTVNKLDELIISNPELKAQCILEA